MGWAVGTITNHASRLGLDFDREATRAATDARQVDLRDQRQQAQQRLMDFFNHQLDRAQNRYLVHGFSHTGESVVEWLQEPPARETKDLTTAATQALNAALKLAQVDAESGIDTAKGALGSLGAVLTALYGQPEVSDDPGNA